jgi:hypothetical protein
VHRRIAKRSDAAAHDHSIGHGDDRAQITPIGRGPDDPAHDQANAPNGGSAAFSLTFSITERDALCPSGMPVIPGPHRIS